jgi:hypothetical protein
MADTKPHLDVSKEPQTLSMEHQKEGDGKKPSDRLDQDQAPPEDDGGRKTSFTWNE